MTKSKRVLWIETNSENLHEVWMERGKLVKISKRKIINDKESVFLASYKKQKDAQSLIDALKFGEK